MTNNEKMAMFQMRLEGKTFQQIGDAFGISKQAVKQSIGCTGGGGTVRRPDKIIYPTIADYMVRRNINYNDLAPECGVSRSGLRHFLQGQGGGSKYVIDRILEVTGLTYEEAFKEREF